MGHLFAPGVAPVEPALAPGLRCLGDYELLEEIARGGMGIVYRARQISLGREVAVKVLRDSAVAGAEEVRRFRVEAAAAAGLKHPHLVTIHEVGEQDGQHFFAMDLVEGGDLAERTREGPLPPREAAALAATIAGAVQHAHERGVLHRDLKPSNVLINRQGQPVVTDFGLARTFDGASTLTLTGQVLGTPGYMAPEQAGGNGVVGPAVDIHGLGAVLYYLLTGRGPFVGGTMAETLRHVVEQEPVSPHLLNPEVSRDLAAVCLKCLAKRPVDRYGAAADLAADLWRVVRGEPTVARPAGTLLRMWRWCQRKPALAGALALSVCLALGGALGVLWQWRERREQLWHSLGREALFSRTSGQVGQRTNALAAVELAAAIRPSQFLRDQAVAALLLPDLGTSLTWKPQADYDHPLAYTRDLEHYLPYETSGRLSVRRTVDHRVVADLGRNQVTPNATAQFSPDGRFVAVLLDDGRLCVWDWRKARKVAEVQGRKPVWGLRSYDFAPDNRSLAYGDSLRGVCRIPLAGDTGEVILEARSGRVLRVSPSGRYLALARGTEVEIWDVAASRTLMASKLEAAAPFVLGLAWHPSEEILCVGGADTLFLWPWRQSGPRRVPGDGEGQEHFYPYFNSCGDLLFSAGGVWDAATGSLLLGLTPGVRSVALSADGRRLAANQVQVGYGLWEFPSPSVLRKFVTTAEPGSVVRTLDLQPGGRHLLAGGYDGWVLWDTDSGRAIARDWLPPTPTGPGITSVKFSFDGRAIYSIDRRGLRRWMLPEVLAAATSGCPATVGAGTLVGPLPGGAGPQANKAEFVGGGFSADGRVAVVVGNGAIVACESESGRAHPSIQMVRRSDNIIALSADGRWLATTRNNQEGGPDLYDLREGRHAHRLAEAAAAGMIWQPNTGELVTQTPSAAVFWQPGSWTRQRVFPWRSPGIDIGFVGFSPDGRTGWLNGLDGALQLVDLNHGVAWATWPPQRSHHLHGWETAFDAPRQRVYVAHAQGVLALDVAELRTQLARLGLDWPDDAPTGGFAPRR